MRVDDDSVHAWNGGEILYMAPQVALVDLVVFRVRYNAGCQVVPQWTDDHDHPPSLISIQGTRIAREDFRKLQSWVVSVMPLNGRYGSVQVSRPDRLHNVAMDNKGFLRNLPVLVALQYPDKTSF